VLEAGVERRRLARARGTGHEDDAVRFLEQLRDLRLGLGIHAQRRKVQPAGLLVEDAHHHAFAMAGWERRHAHVDRAARDPEADTAILRQALLGDVELRHDFDSGHHQRRHRAFALHDLP
jgi:hypothetical protein